MTTFFLQNQFDKKSTLRIYKTPRGIGRQMLKLRNENEKSGFTVSYNGNGIYCFTFTPGGAVSWTPGYQNTYVDDSEYRPHYLYPDGVRTPAVQTEIKKVQGGHILKGKRLDAKETA